MENGRATLLRFLREADLITATNLIILREADLITATNLIIMLDGADLSQADLRGADLRGADLSGERKRDGSDIAKSGDFSACPYCQ